MRKSLILALWLSTAAAYSQTQLDLGRQGKNIDLSNAGSTKPSRTGTGLPPTCSVGETYFRIDAAPGQNLHLCSSANVWSQITGGGGGAGGGFTSASGLVSLLTPTDNVAIGGSTAAGKVSIIGTADQVQAAVRANTTQTSDLFQFQGNSGAILSKFDKDGFLAQGVGVTTGHSMQLGNSGDTGRSSLTIWPGNLASLPPFLRMLDSAANSSYLFPCGSLPGRFCQDSVAPGIPYTNPLMTTDSADTMSNKIFGSTNRQSSFIDWDQIATPGAFPAAGRLRIYAKTGSGICWMSSTGTETCAGAGGGSAVWGGITGTLSDQTDLQSALNVKANSTHTHAASEIASGTLSDARVAESNVTQHQASLAIAATQIGNGSVSDTEFQYLDGVTSAIQTQINNKQASDSDLTALATNTTNGLWARLGSGAGEARTLTAGSGIAVTNGDGVAGNPTIALSGLSNVQLPTGDTVNSTSETNFATTYSIPANFFNTGKALIVTGMLQATTTGSPGTVTLKLKLGSTTIWSTTTSSLIASVTNRGFGVTWMLLGTEAPAASATMLGQCVGWTFPASNNQATGTNTVAQPVGGIATNGSLALTLSAQFSASGQSMTLMSLVVKEAN